MTVIVTVAVAVWTPSEMRYVNVSVPTKPGAGRYVKLPFAATTPPMRLPTDGPLSSEAVSGSPSASVSRARTPGAATTRSRSCRTVHPSSTATGATSVTSIVTVAAAEVAIPSVTV